MKFLYLLVAINLVVFTQADDCKCRLKNSNRIVNGQVSEEHSIPWIVSLAEKNSHFCGASILNENYILTAAHCIEQVKAENINVRVGVHNVQDKMPEDQVYQVKKIHSYKFKNVEEKGDIAILELSRNITFVDNVVEKGCFNLEKRSYKDQLLAAGWGMTDKTYIDLKNNNMVYNGEPDNLKQAFFLEDTKCADYSICIKPVADGDSPCQGDSGGPIHYTENGITKVEGVFSYTDGKKIDNKAYYCVGTGAYSRLSFYADWISEIADFNFCGSGPKTKPKYKREKFLGIF